MKKELVTKSEIKLIGFTARTSNKYETNPATSKIAELAGRFWNQSLANEIPNRKNPGITFSVYTDYEDKEYGEYTYFIGEEVNSWENIPEGFQPLTIPAATYQKFTTLPGKMPEVIIQAWEKIWKMSKDDFEGERTYIADFEIFDERATDPAHASLDIYIGIRQV